MAGDDAAASEPPRVRRGSNFQVDISQLPIARPKPARSTVWKPALHEDDPYWQRRDRFSKTLPITEGPAHALWPDYSIGSTTWSIEEEKDFVLGIFLFEKNFKPISRFIGDGQQKNFIQCRWYYYNKFKRALHPLYHAFKLSSLQHSKEQHVRGSLMVLGNRGRKLLARLFHHVTDAKVQDRIMDAHSKMARNEMSLEKFVRLLRKHSSAATLWAAFSIGQEDDLSSCHYHLFAEKSSRRSRLVANSRYRDCSTLEIQEELAQMDIRATPTSQMSDLFHMGVWPRLERLGWHLETVHKGNGRNMVYYCCPALARFTKGAQRGVEYFDASRALLSFVAHNLSVLDEKPETPTAYPSSNLDPQYQGVEKRGDRWRSYLMFEPEDGQSELVELGDFTTAERAAAAHDIAALKYIGHLAPRNFTHDFEQDEGLARMSATEAAAWLAEQAQLLPSPPAPPATSLRSPHPFSPPITPRPGALSGGFSPCLSDPMKSPRMQRPAPLSLSQLLRVAAEAAGQGEASKGGPDEQAREGPQEAWSPAALQLSLGQRRAAQQGGRGAYVEDGWTEQHAAASLVAAAVRPETTSTQLSHQMAAIKLHSSDSIADGQAGNGIIRSSDIKVEGALPAEVALCAEGTHEGDPRHWWMQQFLEARASMERRREGSPDEDEWERGRRVSRKGSEGPEGPAGAGRHVCPDCGLSFESAQQLGGHRVVHKRPAGSERFRCRTCGKGFETLQALGGHQKTHQPAQRARLPRDDQETEAKGDGHSSRAPGPGWLQCPTCLDWFKNGHALGGHQRVHGGQQFPPMKGIRSGPRPPPEINVFLVAREEKPVACALEGDAGDDLDDEEVLGEIIYRQPGDDSGDDDDMDDGEAGAGDAYGRRRAGRPRMKKAGKYQCRKCDATFPTSRGRDGHQRMHGPSAGAVVRRGPSAEPYHDGAPYGPMAAGWGSDDADPTREAAPEPPPAQYAQVNLATGEARADDRAAEEGGEGQPATVGPGAEEVGAGDMLPFTAARSRRMRKPRRFESFEWQTDEWRREEKMDETAPPVGADGSGSDGDMESSGSERDAHVFACNECTAVFPSARSLGSHRKLHRSERRRRLEELRAMSEDGHYGSEVGPKAEPHAAGAPAERREAAEPHAKARALEVGREVYGGCILANGRYRCNTCFKDFGTGQALGGHQRIHSSGPTPAKKKAPKALAKPRKRAPTGTHPKEPHRAAFGRPLSASGSRCVVPGRPAWMDDDDDEEAEEEVRMGGGGEGGWRNAAEESPVGTGRDVAQRWEATAGGGGAECEDSAELLMAIHFQQQERERERERGVAQRGITKPLAASPLGVKARLGAAATAGSEPPQDVEMTVASPTEKVAPAAAQPVAIGIGGPRPRAVAVGGAWHAAARLSAEWAENVPIGQSSVFFPGRAQTDTWPGGEKRKRVLSQLPGASSPESSPANSPQATGPTPSRFHARPTAAHVPAPYRPASMGSPAGAGLSRYGAQALHGQPRGAPETGGRPDPRFLSTLTSSTSAAVTKVGPARLHQCGECGAEFETGAALGGHVGKHRRENEKLREKEAHASDPPSREALRAGIMARVGMSLTPRGGNVKAATARHQAPKKRIMVKFQAQQQQHGPPHPAAPLAAHPAAPSSAYLRMPIAGLSQHPGGAVRLGPYSVPPSQLATGRAPLRLTVQVATSPVVSPARLVRSPTFGRDALPRAAAATASPDPTPRTRDVAALLQNWKAHTDTGGRGEPLQAARTCESPSRTPVRMVSRLAVPPALLTLPNGKADPEAAAPKVLSPGNVNTAARAPMGPLQWEAKLAQRKAASPTGGCKGSSMPAGEGQARTPKARPTGERAVNAPRSAT